jgi:hypothetical protein
LMGHPHLGVPVHVLQVHFVVRASHGRLDSTLGRVDGSVGFRVRV